MLTVYWANLVLAILCIAAGIHSVVIEHWFTAILLLFVAIFNIVIFAMSCIQRNDFVAKIKGEKPIN